MDRNYSIEEATIEEAVDATETIPNKLFERSSSQGVIEGSWTQEVRQTTISPVRHMREATCTK